MLELKNVTKTFFAGTANEKKALRGVSFTLEDGDFCTVIGSNGAGKSTMLNATAGTFFVDSGKVIIDGSDVTNLPEHKRAAFIGRVFQDPMMGTAPSMWIEENLALAARLALDEAREQLPVGIGHVDLLPHFFFPDSLCASRAHGNRDAQKKHRKPFCFRCFRFVQFSSSGGGSSSASGGVAP